MLEASKIYFIFIVGKKDENAPHLYFMRCWNKSQGVKHSQPKKGIIDTQLLFALNEDAIQ